MTAIVVRRHLVPLLAVAALGAHDAAMAAGANPAINVTLSASAGHDSNVFLAETGRLANRESAFSSASARLATKVGSDLALAYAAAATRFWDETTEDNLKHTLAAAWTRKLDAFSWNAATEFALVDGDDQGADYGSGNGNAFSTAAPRERRDQWQNKTDLALRFDTAPGFIRAVGKLQYWDMRTSTVNGCNYVDRHDVQGGLDFGRALSKGGPEAYLGYRHGYQFQDNDFASATLVNASNHYDRALVGFDGSPVKSLKVAAQAGWSKHAYNADYAGSANEEGLFTDLTLTWNATAADEFCFKTSQSRTVSTTGKNSLLATSHQLAWKHVFTPRWSTTLTGRVSEAEYTPYRRDDFDCTALASVTWNATKTLSCSVTASHDWGRDHLNGLADSLSEKRDFDRTLVSAGVTWKL